MRNLSFLIFFVLSTTISIGESSSFSDSQLYDRFYSAILENRLDDLEQMMDDIDDINSINNDDESVFEAVFIMNNCEAAEILLRNNFNVELTDKNGVSVESKIINTKNKRLISLLNLYKGES